ncbi:RbsD/FucU domain-containing protein [Shigella flexneri]
MLVHPSPKYNAYRYGINPGCTFFMQVLGVVTNEMQVEAAIIAEEIKQHNPQLHQTLLTHLEQLDTREIPLKFVTPRMNNSKTNPQKVRRYLQRRMFSYGDIILAPGVTFSGRHGSITSA